MSILYMDTYGFFVYNGTILEGVRPFWPAPGRGDSMESRKVSAAQRKATDKYLEKFEELRARVPKGQKDTIKAHADSMGESVNAFIGRAIIETMERDKEASATVRGCHHDTEN